MNPEVRDKKVALTQRRIADAEKSKTQHQNHITRLNREITAHKAELAWLRSMPVSDQPAIFQPEPTEKED
jgi:glucose-6-phosphate dehydrogenase assembly protein OpcA